jgi:hypothetical protein
MEILQTAVTSLVVAAVGLALARVAGQRFDSIEASIVALRAEAREDLARVEARLDRAMHEQGSMWEARFAKLDANVNALDRTFDAKIDALDAKLDAKVDSLRADLTQIALAVGARPRRDAG